MATNAKNLAELLNTDTTVAATDVADNSITAAKLDIVGNGTSGQFLKTDGDGSFSYIDAPTVQTPTQQIITATGNWTKPTNCTKVKVTVIGGGGGSGGARMSTGTGGTYYSHGGGGGAGGCAIELIDVSGLADGATVSVTIGNGGAAGSSSPGVGGTGNTSSFGTYCSATGGAGGSPSGPSSGAYTGNLIGRGNAGGIGSDGDINLRGEEGKIVPGTNPFIMFQNTTVSVMCASGGVSHLNNAVHPTADQFVTNSTIAATAGVANTGNGGSGAVVMGTGALIRAASGAAGGSGVVIVDEFYS